ncbi:MFS myo-inositol transporter [Schizosaccharomyces japonicus yFS275]|uniref:MFS myo-inositol transporter n=1 Tax=Schizosaccharomyces japonicus (strain yFS275 / FY16936) TaxID=402676 RepID=B6K4N3_SCHJY|nr:MFS myo-inositol transporter [Schizosaccharomyces japonicus yFS275]EEB08440.1 MFS myo-inositol transporter [Schizosaccharomyces japonicus yFS275]
MTNHRSLVELTNLSFPQLALSTTKKSATNEFNGTSTEEMQPEFDDVLKNSSQQFIIQSPPPDRPGSTATWAPSVSQLESTRIGAWIWLLSIVAGIAGLLFGYDTGVISGALVLFGTDLGHTLSDLEKELITAATALAALLAGIFSSWLADVIGRKRLLVYADFIFVIGAAVMACSKNVGTMIAGRFIVGWAIGLASLIVPMYISELSPAHLRGRLVIIYVVFITGGQLLAYSLNAAFENVYHGWRYMMAFGALPAIGQLIFLYWTPESPRFLLKHNEVEKVYSILSRIHPYAKPNEIAFKVSLIQEGVAADTSDDSTTKWQRLRHSFHLLFTVPSNRRSLFIACVLQAFQQFSGTNAIQYFSATIFKSMGFKNAIATSIVIGATNFVFTCLAFMSIDHVGRRRTLLYTSWGMMAGLVMCSISYKYLKTDSNGSLLPGVSRSWPIVILLSIIVFLASYASGIGNIPWQQAELFTMEVRALGVGIATAVNWAGNLIVGATFLTLMSAITPTGTFALFAGLCFLGWITCYFAYPELAGLPIEEVSKILERGFCVKELNERNRKRRRH